MVETETVAVIGIVVVGVLGYLTGEYQARRRYQRRQADAGDGRLEFGEVCLAAARAKADYVEGSHPAVDREFVDGTDAVLGELLAMGHGDDPLEMRLAYLAGGDTIDFDAEEIGREDFLELAELIGEEIDDPGGRL